MVIVIAGVLWFAYLVPTWLRRREYLATERNAIRLQQTLRILAETTEVPAQVRAEASARSVLAQQRALQTALRAQQRRAAEAARAAHLPVGRGAGGERGFVGADVGAAAGAAAVRAGAGQAGARFAGRPTGPAPVGPAPTGAGRSAGGSASRSGVPAPQRLVSSRRLRRSRLLASTVLLGALIAAGFGVGSAIGAPALIGSWLLLGGSGLVAFGSFVLLGQLATVGRMQATVARVSAAPPRRTAASSPAMVEPLSSAWTPVPLPKPLYLSRDVPAGSFGSVRESAAAFAETQAGLLAAAAQAEGVLRAVPRPPVIRPAAAVPAVAAAEVSRFARMGLVEDSDAAPTDLDAVLRRRRAMAG